MSSTADVPFVKLYEGDVHEAYQRTGSRIRNMTRLKTGVKGTTLTWQKIGTAKASTKARHGLVPVSDTQFTNASATLVDYYSGDWSDKLDEMKTNIDERQSLAKAGGYALGRTTDDLILAQLDLTSNSNAITQTTSVTFRNGVLLARQEHFANNVPDDGDNFAIVSNAFWSWLMTIEEFKSSDYVGQGSLPWTTGQEMKSWAGIKWIEHSGVPGAGTATEKNFLFHRSAIGLAESASPSTDITWHGDRAAHFISNSMSLGAALIDELGVVEMTISGVAPLPTT
jgi:hypothetical protein